MAISFKFRSISLNFCRKYRFNLIKIFSGSFRKRKYQSDASARQLKSLNYLCVLKFILLLVSYMYTNKLNVYCQVQGQFKQRSTLFSVSVLPTHIDKYPDNLMDLPLQATLLECLGGTFVYFKSNELDLTNKPLPLKFANPI